MRWIREDLLGYVPYHAAPPGGAIPLDNNESPFRLSAAVRRRLLLWIENEENLNRYPDSDAFALRRGLALFHNAAPENFLCGVGSDQIIDYLTKVFISPGDTVVTLKPTFSMYRLAALLNHARVKEIPPKDGFCWDIHDIIQTVEQEKAKLLFLCTPNNPTGHCLPEKELLSIVSAVGCPVVVDEAYAEFAGQTVIPQISRYENLVVLRTFSKAYGLAGVRVGYAAACEAMIDAVSIVKAPYNLPTLSQLLALWVLEDSAEYKERIERLTAYKDDLYEKLSKLSGLTVYPSAANFLFLTSAVDLAAALLKEGFLVRDYKNTPGLRGIRLSVGDSAHNERVYEIIRKSLAEG